MSVLFSISMAGVYVDPISALPVPRAISIGNAYTATGADIFSAYYNPAGLKEITDYQLAIINTSTLDDVSLTGMAFAYQLESGVIYIGYTSLGVASFTHYEYDSGGQLTEAGKISNSNTALSLGYSTMLYDRTYGGVILNSFSNSLDSSYDKDLGYSGSGMSIDLGVRYLYSSDLTLALVMKNINGGEVGYSEAVSDEIQKSIILGAAYWKKFKNRDYLISFDYESQSNGSKMGLMHAGISTALTEILDARAGLNGVPASNGSQLIQEFKFSFGFGLQLFGAGLDYAYYPGYGEGETKHFISIAYGPEQKEDPAKPVDQNNKEVVSNE